jgi:pimeloyl-ACP methyl ester carboxylesterase
MRFMSSLDQRVVAANGIRINIWLGGRGTPLVLLHGYRQTGQMRRKVALAHAEEYFVVCPNAGNLGRARMHKLFDMLASLREKALDVHGRALVCGHFIRGRGAELVAEPHAFLASKTCIRTGDAQSESNPMAAVPKDARVRGPQLSQETWF